MTANVVGDKAGLSAVHHGLLIDLLDHLSDVEQGDHGQHRHHDNADGRAQPEVVAGESDTVGVDAQQIGLAGDSAGLLQDEDLREDPEVPDRRQVPAGSGRSV